MPQLSLKVPIFRRWGKKFFVATDSLFFAEVPPIRPVNTITNSEVTWLVYPFAKEGDRFSMGDPELQFTTWADVETSLREGTAPEPDEVLLEVLQKKQKYKLPVRTA